MNYIPDLDIDFSTDEQATRDMLDYAVNQWNYRRAEYVKMERLYDDYNGIVSKKEVESITKSTGSKSKTKYIKYRLGRPKVKQLHGEFLEINMEPTVTTINRRAQNEKMKKYKTMLGMSLAKAQIEKVRTMGYPVHSGMNIPEYNDPNAWNINNFKLANEIAMQNIINDKIKTESLKSKFYQNFVDLTITSECFGKVERDNDGRDTYREINPKNALFEESYGDMFLHKSPYLGERREMFYHDIISNPEFNLTYDDKKKLKEAYNNNTLWYDGYEDTRRRTNYQVTTVYSIEWKGMEKIYIITSPAKNSSVPYKKVISQKSYNKNKKRLQKQEKNGAIQIEEFDRQVLWSAHRIGADIYTKAVKEEFVIQRLNDNGKITIDFNYCGMLFGTVNGVRVSLQEIIRDLDKIYDDIRFQINRELKKIRGDAIYVDEAYLPKNAKKSTVLHDLTEDGVLVYNSSAEGNRTGIDAESNKVGIGAMNLGQSQVLNILLTQAIDVERVMDRVTGMNENRQGLTKATTTATTNINNIEASRSITYDMFYFMNKYEEEVLLKLCEKTKLNEVHYGYDSRMFIKDHKEQAYFISTKNIILDNYGITLTDGKKERDTLNRIEQLFPQEINAGMLRTKDVAEFYQAESFSEAIRILDKAHQELVKIREEESRINQETAQQQIQVAQETQKEDREDRQNHEKEMEVMRQEGAKEQILLKESMAGKTKMNEAQIKANSTNQDI